MQNQIYLSGPLRIICGKRTEDNTSNQSSRKGKGMLRWHGAASSNLMTENVLIPEEGAARTDASKSLDIHEPKKRNFVAKMKSTLAKLLPPNHRDHKTVKQQNPRAQGPIGNKETVFLSTQSLLPKLIKDLPSPKLFPKTKAAVLAQKATVQLDVNIVKAETERISRKNTIVRSRNVTRRISVTSLPTGLRKISYPSKKKHFSVKRKKKTKSQVICHPDLTIKNLQVQVDDLIETVADKSTRLLAQRQAELQHCQYLGDEILQSSKQFQRVSKKNSKKYKLKNVCWPCFCCC
ncbi:putative uncharacterized protein C3orf49 homolog [Rhinatrema bivittatum]|uniref:putative uncharacterized protein C3orf49 homolog n=1 Tax=Rhinatrema bivittatum TaxID=194408 RepID=UPI001127B7B9|nr:putative uncharacterized protein C3orf49 homolog [Rhinatrema bivittatum]